LRRIPPAGGGGTSASHLGRPSQPSLSFRAGGQNPSRGPASGFSITRALARTSDSLVRVPRRVGRDHFVDIFNASGGLPVPGATGGTSPARTRKGPSWEEFRPRGPGSPRPSRGHAFGGGPRSVPLFLGPAPGIRPGPVTRSRKGILPATPPCLGLSTRLIGLP